MNKTNPSMFRPSTNLPSDSDKQEFFFIHGNEELKSAVLKLRNRREISPAKSAKERNKIKKIKQHRFSEYFARVTTNDLREIRKASKLPASWNSAIRNWIYFDKFDALSMLNRKFKIHMTSGSERRMFIEVFKTTGFKDLEQSCRQISEWKKFIRTPRKQSNKKRPELIFTEDPESRLCLEVFKDTNIKDIGKVWPQVRFCQTMLEGRPRFRNKLNFGRDRTYVIKIKNGKRPGQILEYMEKIQTTPQWKTEVQPEAYRKALSRYKKRLA